MPYKRKPKQYSSCKKIVSYNKRTCREQLVQNRQQQRARDCKDSPSNSDLDLLVQRRRQRAWEFKDSLLNNLTRRLIADSEVEDQFDAEIAPLD